MSNDKQKIQNNKKERTMKVQSKSGLAFELLPDQTIPKEIDELLAQI